MAADPGDELADSALELADVGRARIDLGGRRLERDHVRREPVERDAEEPRLADAVLTDEQERPARRLLERIDDRLDELAPPAGEERLRPVGASLEDPADAVQELDIHGGAAPLLEVGPEVVAEVVLESVDERLEELDEAERQVAPEGLDAHLLAACPALLDEDRERAPVDALVELGQHRPDHRIGRL